MILRAIAVTLLLAAAAAADSSVPAKRQGAPSPEDRAAARVLYTEAVQLYDAKKFAESPHAPFRCLGARRCMWNRQNRQMDVVYANAAERSARGGLGAPERNR